MNNLSLRGSLLSSLAFSALVYASGALSSDQDFRLMGLATHQETGRNIYLGAIHLTSGAPTPDKIAQSRAPKMMEYRIVARRTSMRSLVGKMLLQSEVANNAAPSNETIEFADELLGAVRGSLYAGDSLRIQQNRLGELLVLLNNTELTRTADSGIFDYLMKGWVSENGPTTAFRSSILKTDIPDQLLSTYEATSPSGERIEAITAWFSNDTELSATADSELMEILPTQALPNDTLALPAAGTADPDPMLAPATAPVNDETPGLEQVAAGEPEDVSVLPDTKRAQTLVAVNEADAETETETETTDTLGELVEFEQAQNATYFEVPADQFDGSIVETSAARSLDSKFEDTQVWTFAEKSRIAPIVLPDSQDNDPFDILSLDVTEYAYRLAEFNNALVRLVYSKIRYPKRAVRRSIQGALELDVTVLADGSLVEVAIVESSGYSILDDAALAAAREALQDMALGEVDPVAIAEFGIEGSVVVPVPVNFVLQD